MLARHRLFHRLDQARRQPVIWVSGPPGSGKTTLVASYLRTRKLRTLWYQVDEGDADPATFFHYLGLAAQKAAPRYRQRLPHLTPEYLPGLPTFTQRFFEGLYGRLTPPCVVVLDNYQQVPAESQFHEILQIGLSEIPTGFSVIIMSRKEPPPQLVRLQVVQTITVLDEEALRLTATEAASLIRLHATQRRWRPEKAWVERVHRKTQGWVAGVVLFLEQAKLGQGQEVVQRDETPEVVFEYLAREVMEGLSPEVQGFLLKTALLPTMTVGMAERLTGLASADQLLAAMYRTRYFTERRLEADPVYQYHPLFREFLLAQAWKTFSSEQVTSLQRTAATLLEEAGRTEEAMTLLQAAGQVEEQVRLLLTHAPTLLGQGRAQTVEGWLRKLPSEQVNQNPWLQYWLGSCRFPVNPGESEKIFERAFEQFQADGNRDGALLAWCGAVESIHFNWSDLSRLDLWIDRLPQLLDSRTVLSPPALEARVAYGVLTALRFRRLQDPGLKHWVARCTEVLRQVPDVNQRMTIGCVLINHVAAWMGDLQSASEVIGQLRESIRSTASPPLAQASLYLAEAVYAWMACDTRRCIEAVRKGQEVATKYGMYIFRFIFLGTGVYGALQAGDLATADSLLRETSSGLSEGHDTLRSHYHLVAGWVALLRGDLHEAWLHVENALKLAIEKEGLFQQGVCRFATAQVLHERGQREEADHHLALARQIANETESQPLKFMCLTAEAQFALGCGNVTGGLQALRQAMTLGRARGFADFPWWRPTVMARLCAKALEAGIEVEYVQHLIRKRRLVPEVPALAPETWPWPVKIVTLGRFEVLSDSEPLSFSRKVQRRPLALLKAIIAFGGREVPEMQLSDAFWPEAEGDAAHEAFATTLHRLRRLVRHDKVIQLQEGKVTLNRQTCWVDAWAFEALVEQAEATDQARHSERSLRACEKAMSLYQGPFLPESLEEPWAQATRERLRRKFIRLVRILSDHWQRTGELEQAVAYLERGLAVDPLAEPLYQKLITCLHQLGRLERARAWYDRCREILWTTLGAEPSPETKAVYAKVRPL